MARTPSRTATWVPIAWTVGGGLLTFAFFGGIFYATTQSQISTQSKALEDIAKRYNDGITELSRVIKGEGEARAAMEKAEAGKREEMRKEYFALMRDQTKTFEGLGDKLVGIGTKVEVMGSRYEAVDRRLNQMSDDMRRVLEQTAPRRPAATPGGDPR